MNIQNLAALREFEQRCRYKFVSLLTINFHTSFVLAWMIISTFYWTDCYMLTATTATEITFKGQSMSSHYAVQRHSHSLARVHIIDCLVCLTTCPQHLPKPILHKERSSASSFNVQFLSFPYGHLVGAYIFLVFQSLFFFLQPVLKGSSYARCDQSS